MFADLIPLIASMEGDEDHPYHPRPSMSGPMHGPDISTRCLRSMVYHAAGFKADPLSGRAILVFDDSSWHEELTIDWLRKSAGYKFHSPQMHVNINLGLSFIHERECRTIVGGKSCGEIIPSGHIGGHIDILATSPVPQDFLIEHKAINHFTFQKIWGGELPIDYVFQACNYLHGIQKYINPNMGTAFLLVKNKNTAAYLEIEIDYDSKNQKATVLSMVNSIGQRQEVDRVLPYRVVEETSKKFQAVHDAVETKTFPPRPYEMTDWHCEYCRYGKQCWEGYEEEFKGLTEDAALTQEIEQMCAYYQELGMHIDQQKDEREGITGKLMEILREKEVRKGKVGNYTISRVLRHNTSWNADLIPAATQAVAKKDSLSEFIKISMKGKKKGEK